MNIKKLKKGLKEVVDSFKSESLDEKITELKEKLNKKLITKEEFISEIQNFKEEKGILEQIKDSREFKIAKGLTKKFFEKCKKPIK